ncbi:MAG: extensin family protein [Pseudomonadota bacterium]
MKFLFLIVPIVIGLISAVHVHAGPVARELEQRQGNVGHPVPRPADALRSESARSPAPQVEESLRDTRDEPRSKGIEDTCLNRLKRVAQARRSQTPESDDPACIIPDPVVLVSTAGDNPVTFPDGLTLDCRFAERLALFVRDTAQPLASFHLGSPLQTIVGGQGFTCRRRNNAPTGKLSEHAFGNGFDLTGLRLADGRIMSIKSQTLLLPNEARLQQALRSAACGSFTTVLGPGSNPAHATHLHLDLGRTTGENADRKNPYRICE